MRVKAIAKGFDGMVLREPGSIFEIKPQHFSAKWMKKLEEKSEAKSPKSFEGKKPGKSPEPVKPSVDEDVI